MSNQNVQAEKKVNPLVVGIDVGNGYVKANVGNTAKVYPSIMVKQFNTSHNQPVGESDLPIFMTDVVDNMDLSFSSPLIKSTARRLFGERALKSGLNLEEFDVYARTSKSEVDLSGGLVLGTIAADQLERHYNRYKTLPTTGVIKTTVNLATALPISEHNRFAREYKRRYENSGKPHLVMFHNFDDIIRVEITFKEVFISSEGESAQYGLQLAEPAFLEMIHDEAVSRFPDGELDGITGKDLVTAPNTLGIDIGEGTIDFAVFTNGAFNSDASTTFNQGYGEVLEATLGILQDEGYPYKSRKELSEFIHTTPSPLARKVTHKRNHVREVNQVQEDRFGDLISSEVSKVYSKVGTFVEVIFVYGGGATPLEWALFDKLQMRVKEFGTDLVPIVYLDSKFSRFLNVQGLYQVAKRLEEASK